MAGRVQLETSGPQDIFFTDNPEYTYFVKNFKKHAKFASFTTDLDVEGEIDFGNTIECTIPQDQGDLLKNISIKVELSALDQDLKSQVHNTDAKGIGYNESIGHAMIEYIELYIGSELIQRIPRDFLAIYSDNYVTQTKQNCLKELIGKPAVEYSGHEVNDLLILGSLGYATNNSNYFIDIPFYFHNNPELAIPLCAIKKQEIKVVIKLSEIKDCIWCESDTSGSDKAVYTGLSPKNMIKELKIVPELVSLSEKEKNNLIMNPNDYIITQIQENKFIIPSSSTSEKFRLDFINPVKELFFLIQTENSGIVNQKFYSAFDYDLFYEINTTDNAFTNYEHLKYLKLTLDGSENINKETGNVINLRAVQSGIHHSRTQLFRRYYSYSFALEPERWYPTGQINFSLIKDKIVELNVNPHNSSKRELRVLAHSYNILRVENGTARTLF
tara:strand:- start:724 stop:2052 length:1329 start_codon:yes stop_codon:yes gene_type:complete